jgi:hypothetical protein
MNEQLINAFKELRTKGILALHGWTCCQTCGRAEAKECIAELSMKGSVFYHAQAQDSALQDGELCLNFFGLSLTDLEVGMAAADVLRKHGLDVHWDNTPDTAIMVRLGDVDSLRRVETGVTDGAVVDRDLTRVMRAKKHWLFMMLQRKNGRVSVSGRLKVGNWTLNPFTSVPVYVRVDG